MVVVTLNRRQRRASWADLPEDMLGDVLRRLPSFADRYRFRAVCRAWRAAWCRQPHPPAPWLVVPGHCVSLPDGEIHRVAPLPEDARAAPCRGSFGDWIALVPLASSGGGAPFLLNPLSGARIPLPPWTDQKEPFRKIVMSSSPDDSNCVVAAMVDCGENRRRIAACRPGEGHEGAWWPVSLAFDLHDILFYEGRLHALPSRDKLVVFDDGELDLLRREPWKLHEKQLPPPPAANVDYDDGDIKTRRYLVEFSKGHLLTVVRHARAEIQRTVAIEVHELEPNGSWVPIKRFDGHALFVGDACSGSFPAAASSTSHDLIRESQVCFVDDEMAISAELDKRKRSAPVRTVKASGRLGDLYGSVLRRLRSVEIYSMKGQCINFFRAGDTSARTGRWHLKKNLMRPGLFPDPRRPIARVLQ